jgi:hypothetical protein
LALTSSKLERWIDGLGRRKFSHDGTHMGWKPHRLGKVPKGLFIHMMEDVATTLTHTSFKDGMKPFSP